jgi:hypothetical protein
MSDGALAGCLGQNFAISMSGVTVRDVVAQWSRHLAGNRLIVSLNPTSTRLWWHPCGVAWDAVHEPGVKYINPEFLFF